ncbi:MAG: BA14K family protein [Planctomycetes bacterium]|nr:BA14K family protein [Planctomycetota bacterium]
MASCCRRFRSSGPATNHFQPK